MKWLTPSISEPIIKQMPTAKKILNLALLLFILFSIPVTVFIAKRANLNSSASGLALSLSVTPASQAITKTSSAAFVLNLNFSESRVSANNPILLHFSDLPEGVALQPQPLGATPSNNFQKTHHFNVVTGSNAALGTYKVEITATDMVTTQKTSFSFTVR